MPKNDGSVHTPIALNPAGYLASVITVLALTGVSQVLSAANTRRKAFLISNTSLVNFADVMFGAAAVVGQGIRLGSLGGGANKGHHRFDSNELGFCHTGSINVIGTAGQSVTIIEWST